jgi:flagellar hook-associated protein 3 FlgL
MPFSPVGIPDALSAERLARAHRDVKLRLETAQIELTTGEAADKVAATNGDPLRLFALDSAIATLDSRKPLMELARSRAGAMQTALETVEDSVGDLPVDLLGFAQIGDLGSANRVARDARSALGQIMSALNVSVSGRHVFGGDDAGALPLATADALIADVGRALAGALLPADIPNPGDPAPSPQAQLDHYFGVAPIANAPAATTFAENIYKGGAGAAPPVELATGDRLSYSVNADAPPLVALMRELAVIVGVAGGGVAYPTEADKLAAYRGAAAGALAARDAVTQLRADLGDKEKRIESGLARSEAEKSTLSIARNDLIGRDEFETASRVKQLETQLQTIYALTARAFDLTLLNFLR